MVGSIIRVLLEIYFAFRQWKNFENPLRIDNIIAMSMVYYFLAYLPLFPRYNVLLVKNSVFIRRNANLVFKPS